LFFTATLSGWYILSNRAGTYPKGEQYKIVQPGKIFVVLEPEVSTLLIPVPVTGHDIETVISA
jgi:hypothetical protein